MQRALATLSADFRDQADLVVKSHIEGVELTERELMKVMEKHGIKRFDPQGQKFDPNLHQAMAEQDSEVHPPGTVMQAWTACWTLNGRLLKPAMVVVAKAPTAELPSSGYKINTTV